MTSTEEATITLDEATVISLTRSFCERIGVDAGRVDNVVEVLKGQTLLCRHENDVFEGSLAAACALGDQRAIMELLAQHGRLMRTTAATILNNGDAIDECLQRVRVRLFVGDARGPRIGAFAPGGTLRGWLQTVTMREALMQLRARPNESHTDTAELADMLSTGDSELDMLKKRYGTELREAFKRAIESAPADDRNLLREHILNEHSIDDLAATHGISRATAARWLSRARDGVAERVREDLKGRLRLDTQDLESILRLVRSQVDLSISSQLRS